MSDIIFKGPNCKLKGKYYRGKNDNNPFVLILYPESKLDVIPDAIQSVISILLKNDFSIFCFNFKRLSNVITDPIKKKEEELAEVISTLNWISDKCRENKSLWLFGFFSACWTGLQVVMRRPEITDYILFSPSTKAKDFTFIVPCSSNGMIVYESTTQSSVDEIVEKLLNKSDSSIETMPIDNCDIEKGQNISEMLGKIEEYIKKRLLEDSGKIRKIKRDRRRRKKKKNIIEEEKNIHLPPIKSLDFD